MYLEAGITFSLPYHKTCDKSMKYSDKTKLGFAKPSNSVPLKLSKKDAARISRHGRIVISDFHDAPNIVFKEL